MEAMAKGGDSATSVVSTMHHDNLSECTCLKMLNLGVLDGVDNLVACRLPFWMRWRSLVVTPPSRTRSCRRPCM